MRPLLAARTPRLKAIQRVQTCFTCRRRKYATIEASKNDVQDCDIVIVGGGPAGLAFANALVSHKPVRESLRIALIEASDLSRVRQWSMPEGTFSNRVSSRTNASRQFLVGTGAWNRVDETRVTRIEEMQVWDGISDARINFTANEIGFSTGNGLPPYMATMTENLNLQRALIQSLDDVGGVEIIDNTKVSNIEKDTENAGWPIVRTSNGEALRARLLVGADGPNSPVRSYAGIDSYGWAYDTRAIVATLFHAPRLNGLQSPNTTAYQRFLPTGPIAFLPLSPTASSFVWSTKPALAAALTSVDPKILTYMINAAFRLPGISIRHLHRLLLEEQQNLTAESILEEIRWRERSHDIDQHSAYSSHVSEIAGIPPDDTELVPPVITSIQPGTVASFPLRMSHADSYIGEDERGSRIALLGDAGHTIHPLAGQGLNMGLGDAQALADCICSAVLVGGDVGSRTALLPYARGRYFENHKLLSAVDKLHKLYGTSLPPVVWARSVGLEVVNEIDALKAAIMLSAGSGPGLLKQQAEGQGVSPWSFAANGVEVAGDVVEAAKIISRTLQGLVSTGLKHTSETMERR
ncbi:ubiquinone biosynthesis hydrox [Fomitiporia mediterranea MF3/22]|uniref:ubiquinone biosynthesis hydrox n=1 Tax=Fomitiporia mediterranea (strain MF3/22) TaxID=694068 RepID=UPI0004409A31|nr:ubiquinone biosynthesis hydrox [Fomitiporia mediterranea MF3/22]EJD07319.1 ubiquinone biosynthesis hydrox [Fomitiporia mediterranea MF3/22]